MAEAWAGNCLRIVALSVIFLFLATVSWALQSEGPETQKPLTRGFHQLEFAPDNGDTLRCSLWVPPLEAKSTVPLVVALHYGGEVIDIGSLMRQTPTLLRRDGTIASACPWVYHHLSESTTL